MSGVVGFDNIIFTTNKKCSPRYIYNIIYVVNLTIKFSGGTSYRDIYSAHWEKCISSSFSQGEYFNSFGKLISSSFVSRREDTWGTGISEAELKEKLDITVDAATTLEECSR